VLKKANSLKRKIIILLSALLIFITFVMVLLFIDDINKLVNSNINLFSTTLLKKEKKELHNKITLASNVIKMYYKQTTPKYIEEVAKHTLKLQQEQLFSQLTNFYEHNKNKYTKKQLREKLIFLVKYARYGSNGYFWINDMNYKMIMHPIKENYSGKYFFNNHSVPFVALAINKLKKSNTNETYIKYKFYNPATKKYEFKVSLVKIFKPFNWIIGTGRYLSDITPIMQKHALKDIKALRYGDNGYFWINDTNYTMIMHPIKPSYDGKQFIDTPKVPFVQLGVDALKKSQLDTAIIEYSFYNPATKEYENKLSVVKVFKPWNWIIGTGVYLNSIDESISKVKISKDKEEKVFIFNIIMVAIAIILLTIFIAYYLIGRFIVNPINDLHKEKDYFEEISQIDYLTNILNRRAFFKAVKKSFAYAKRHDLSVAVLMIDIDHFKNVNDSYGHEAGDYVLKELTKIISKHIREEDIFGRLGGEEFGICVFNNSNVALCAIAQKIRKAIEENVVNYQGIDITFTISIGGYKITSEIESFEIALNKADKALYIAKAEGRNKVIFYDAILCAKT
jgi:methyl-accepting chemotaxis protein